MQVQIENIPKALKQSPNFVLWRKEKRDGRETKVPYQRNGRYAKSDDPTTWTNYSAAVSALINGRGKYNGIGFCLSEGTPIGIDLDHCRCPAFPDTEIIVPWAMDIIKEVNSYTESSPSGKGIRIFAYGGKLPAYGRKKGLPEYGGDNCRKDVVPAFEIYESGRYLTVTGNRIAGTPTDIMSRPEAIAAVHKRIFSDTATVQSKPGFVQPVANMSVTDTLEKAYRSKNGERIRVLYNGNYSDYPSQSEADLALCSHLAFLFDGDAIAIDAAFRESGLFRDKWDTKHHSDGATYGEATIKKAIAGCASFYRDHQTRENKSADLPTLSQPEAWPEPISLPNGLSPVKPLESVMIPAPLRGWLMDIADRMQIPTDFSTAAAVVTLGSIIGRGCGIYPKRQDDWLVVPNLWGAVVGRPSLMKTPAVSEAQRHLNRLEAEARDDYQKAAYAFKIDKEVIKITRAAIGEKIKKAVKDGNNIDYARSELAALQVDEPERRRFQTQDGTVEKIGELLNKNPRGLLINRDELIGWFRSLDREGRENDRPFYLEAWNGYRGYTYDRIGRGTLDIPALSVSIFGAITPGQLSHYVFQANRGGNGDDGLLQRFQVIVWPDAPAEWKNVDRFPDTIEKNRAWKIFKVLSGEIPGAVKKDGADIPALRFSPEGQEIFDQWRHDLEIRLRSDHGLHPAMESHLTKYRKLMPSLGLIFHLVDVADGAMPGLVSETAAIMAVAWCEYLESHAIRIYGAATMPGLDVAREIIKHIRRGAIQDGATVREIWRHQWSKIPSSEDVKMGLEVLKEYEWLSLEKITTKGRASELVRLNPRIKLL